MPLEIERKFLVTTDGWRTSSPTRTVQGYLNLEPARTVRVRLTDQGAVLTIKGKSDGISQAEFEYAIPADEAPSLLKLSDGSLIEKDRHVVEVDGTVWEVDEFLGANAGLVVAEVELESRGQEVTLPSWVGDEITDDFRYKNSNLVTSPFSSWK